MKLKGNIFIRNIGDENFAMLIDAVGESNNKMVRCNDTTKFILDMLKNEVSADEIADAFVKEYSIDKATAKADTEEILEELKKIDFIG